MNTDPKQSDKTAIQNPGSSPISPVAGSLPWMAAGQPAEEIDLVDLGVMLWRRRRLMIWVAGVLIALALLLAIFKQPTYDYTTSIQLGSMLAQDGTLAPLMSPQSASATLQNTYIPNAIYQYEAQQHVDLRALKINVGSNTDSTTVTLTCKVSGKLSAACMVVEKAAAADFVRDNDRAIAVVRASLKAKVDAATLNLVALQDPTVFGVQKLAAEKAIADARNTLANSNLQLQSLRDPAVFGVQKLAAERAIADAKNTLADLKTNAQVLHVREEKLDASVILYQQEAAELQKYVAEVRKASIGAAKAATGPTEALSNLLLGTESQRSVDRLNGIQQILNVTIPEGRALLAKQIADNQRTQQLQNQTIVQNTLALQKFLFNHQQDIQILQNTIQLQKQTIAQNTMALQKLLFDHGQQIQNQNISIGNLQSQLGNIQDNRALGDPLRSLTPVGLGRIAILAIGIVLSFFIALIAALFANYVVQVRARLAPEKTT